MIIPKKVEEKIRYLIRKFPSTEWSGVLFYSHTGSFEDGSLVITCEDIYPMDLGTAGFTEFKMTEEVATYIAENIELFDCETGLVHSHHTLGAFFSGQDIKTLQLEGDDTNCFVSLIVDTKGTYQAAITRKLQTKNEVTIKSLGTSYEFFGEGAISTGEDPMSETTQVIDKEVIQYYMLEIEKEEVINPLSWLDTRFEEIIKRKEAQKTISVTTATKNKLPWDCSLTDSRNAADDFDFHSWRLSNEKEPVKYKEQELFANGDIDAPEAASDWNPDPTIIHYLCCQLLTCSLIVNKDIDLKQWVVKHMVKKYNEIFSSVDNGDFRIWCDSYVEFILSKYSDENTPIELYDNWDVLQARVAEALIDEIGEYPENEYITQYIETLSNYVILT